MPQRVPDVTFNIRVRDASVEGPNPFRWSERTSAEIFGGRSVVLFGLPGAFTPACSESHLPGFEAAHDEIAALGVDEVICTAVNDAFVMFRWGEAQGIEKVTLLPDGNGDFARLMGMLVDRRAQGMGMRSWRYALHAEDGEIAALHAEPGLRDAPDGVPVERSSAEAMLEHLRARRG